MDYEDKRFSKSSSIEQKLLAGKTDELLRSQKALHVFSMVMSHKDSYTMEFLSRNLMGNITGFDGQMKFAMFQMQIKLMPLGKGQNPASMTTILPKTFNNLRDLGISGIKNNEMRYFRERVFLSTTERNSIDLEITEPSKIRYYLKSLIKGVSIKRAYLKNASGTEVQGYIVEKTFDDVDISYDLTTPGTYTLYVSIGAKKAKFGDFFWKLELQPKTTSQKCPSENIPKFNDIVITSKVSSTTQETHYYIGNSMFRNIYHLGQKQVGTPNDVFKVNFPTSGGKNFIVLPFTLEKADNLLTVNIFHDWAEDLIKIYILTGSEEAQDLYDVIQNQKKIGMNVNVQDIDSIVQSNPLEYFEGIEKQFLNKGEYKLVIMHMDTNEENPPTG
jgi:hypothetical protein